MLRARVRVQLVEEAAAIFLGENARETPRLVLQRLHVLNLDNEHVARLGGLNLKRPRKVVHLRQVDVAHIVGTVIVLDLPASPVDALDLDGFAIFDRAGEGDYGLVRTEGVMTNRQKWNDGLSGCHRFCEG